MAFEKKWPALPSTTLTSDGTADGTLHVADAFRLKVKQIVYLKSNTQPALKIQVKRVIDPVTFLVGRPENNINDRVDVSAYTVADAAYVYNSNEFQDRPSIGPEEFNRAVYEEEPTVALRTVMVDRGGRFIGSDPNSPFYVQLTDGSVNIGTVNANVQVQLSAKDNDPNAGDVHDSIRIGDGTNEAKVNPDGSFNVNITPSSTASSVESAYNEVTAVPAATPTLLVSYTAPGGKKSFLSKVFVSGDNVAKYQVKLNGTVIESLRTYFGGDLNAAADFSSSDGGKLLSVGDVVQVYVEHQRPDVGDFNGRIQSIEV